MRLDLSHKNAFRRRTIDKSYTDAQLGWHDRNNTDRENTDRENTDREDAG